MPQIPPSPLELRPPPPPPLSSASLISLILYFYAKCLSNLCPSSTNLGPLFVITLSHQVPRWFPSISNLSPNSSSTL
ncbi:hypothetical protein LguiB_017905 [Lonicera macranthoides]